MGKGSIVKINYVERVKATGRVTDTNVEEIAKDADIFDPENPLKYGPYPTVVGSGRPTKGLDEALLDMKIGDTLDVEVPPEKAYGVRRRELMDHVPQSSFRKQGIRPVRGLPVRTRRGIAIVRSTTGGRIWLDYNHPLAGQTLQYHLELVEEAEDTETKLRWLIGMRLPSVDPESHVIEIRNEKAIVEFNTGDLPEDSVTALRSIIQHDVSTHLPEIKEIVFGPVETEKAQADTGEALEEPSSGEKTGSENAGAEPKASEMSEEGDDSQDEKR